MNVLNLNSLILVIYIYLVSISSLLAPIISTFVVKSALLCLLIVIVLYQNKLKMNSTIIKFYGFLIIFIVINLIVVSHKNLVFADSVNLLMYSFIPVYLLTHNLVSFKYIIEYWMKIAVIFTFLLPVYYIYRVNGFISYFDIGFLAHLNILIMLYKTMIQKNIKATTIIFLIINLGVAAILGSRMVFVSSVLTAVLIFIIFARKNIKFYINLFLMSLLAVVVSYNLLNILTFMNETLGKIGIKSRNLYMFINQVKGGFENSIVLSGRENIYPVISEYLKENTIFPSGFGVARKLTNEVYYHAHNFLLEIILIFGIIGCLVILVAALLKLKVLIKNIDFSENRIMLHILTVLLISFFFRSLTGTYFMTDGIFLFCLGIFVSVSNKEERILFSSDVIKKHWTKMVKKFSNEK